MHKLLGIARIILAAEPSHPSLKVKVGFRTPGVALQQRPSWTEETSGTWDVSARERCVPYMVSATWFYPARAKYLA